MAAKQQTIRAGWYYAARYNGNNGDLIVGRVQSVRTSEEETNVVLINLITSKRALKGLKTLERRNKRVSKPQAMKLRNMYLETGDKAKVRSVAVAAPEFGVKKPKQQALPLKKDLPIYSSICYAADQKRRKAAGWSDMAYVGVNFAKPRSAMEKQAVTFVKARYPNIISVPIYEVVDLVVHLTSRPEKA